MAVFYLIYDLRDMKTDLRLRFKGRWISVLEGSSLGRIRNGPFEAWLYPDEDSGWPGFFADLFRVSGEESAEIYFSGTKEALAAFNEEAKLFADKSGRKILIRSAQEESLKGLGKLFWALNSWGCTENNKINKAENDLMDSFIADLKGECSEKNEAYLTSRGVYLDNIIALYYDRCDHAKKKITGVYTMEFDRILSENYKDAAIILENELLSWTFAAPKLELQTPEYIKDYLEITAGSSLDEIIKRMTGMYETKIMQCKQSLNNQIYRLVSRIADMFFDKHELPGNYI